MAHKLPSPDTDHGLSFVCTVHMASTTARIWDVLTSVSGWPVWNPLVEWTSTQILRESEKFTILSARTLLEADVHVITPGRAAQLRCGIVNRPQPPAADLSVVLTPRTDGTLVTASFQIEPWFLDTLESRLPFRGHTPATLFLAALQRVVTTRVVPFRPRA